MSNPILNQEEYEERLAALKESYVSMLQMISITEDRPSYTNYDLHDFEPYRPRAGKGFDVISNDTYIILQHNFSSSEVEPQQMTVHKHSQSSTGHHVPYFTPGLFVDEGDIASAPYSYSCNTEENNSETVSSPKVEQLIGRAFLDSRPVLVDTPCENVGDINSLKLWKQYKKGNKYGNMLQIPYNQHHLFDIDDSTLDNIKKDNFGSSEFLEINDSKLRCSEYTDKEEVRIRMKNAVDNCLKLLSSSRGTKLWFLTKLKQCCDYEIFHRDGMIEICSLDTSPSRSTIKSVLDSSKYEENMNIIIDCIEMLRLTDMRQVD